jgi:hypothetical protein
MQTQSVFMSGFFEEVKRRKVYQVAVAYVIAAGGIIQLASAAERHYAGRSRRHRFCCCRLLSPSTRLCAQGRQVDCSVAV